MKTLKTRSTTTRKKKLAVRKLPRETMMSKSDKENDLDQRRESKRAYQLGRRDERFSFTEYGSAYRRQREAVQRARKQTRELKREVVRLNALVIKLAEKL